MKTKNQFELLYRLRVIHTYLENSEFSDYRVKQMIYSLIDTSQLKDLFLIWDIEPRFRRNILLIKVDEEIHSLTQNLFAYPCNKSWDRLIATDTQDVKYCNECRKNVYLALDEKELTKRKELKQCVSWRPEPRVDGLFGRPLTGLLNSAE